MPDVVEAKALLDELERESFHSPAAAVPGTPRA